MARKISTTEKLVRVMDIVASLREEHKPAGTIPPWKARQCVHCAAGMPMSAHEGYHWTGNPDPPKCTAVEREPEPAEANLPAMVTEDSTSKTDPLMPPVTRVCSEQDRTVIRDAMRTAEAERKPVGVGAFRVHSLVKQLAECYRLTGADSDGNEDWRLADRAVEEVRRLRQEHDELSAPDVATEELLAAAAEGNNALAMALEQIELHNSNYDERTSAARIAVIQAAIERLRAAVAGVRKAKA